MTAQVTNKKSFSHLSNEVIPVNYQLWLKPQLQTFNFIGKQNINVKVIKATSIVELNSAEIVVKSASYRGDDSKNSVPCSEIKFNTEEEKVTFVFPTPLKVGSGNLSIEFQGELNDKMKGFYRSKYTAPDGKERYAAVTQFEATDARRCFPCWDEPAFKATFSVTLVVPKHLVALSNMNVIEEKNFEEDAQWKVVKYATTPIMSTYLLAFVVGEFDFIEQVASNGVKIRVYTPLGVAEQGRFALEVALKALPFYSDYFGIPYPLTKLDLIAISDFACGAMENWGLVTYRETALLIDESSSSAGSRQYVAIVVSHELAHQWFGNLVTMEWWTHLWLNEGFASFMEYLATDHCHPQFDVWTQFLTDDLIRAMNLDALDSSHPIEVDVGHPNEVDEIFDMISYCKGSSVIRMLHNWIGNESFRSGLTAYLKKHAYKNATTENLWDALGASSGKPVREVMQTWTKQMGFPVLDVACKSRTDNSITLTMTQSKFRADSTAKSSASSSKWLIPISFSTSKSPNKAVKTVLMKDKSMEVMIDNVSRNGWVKLNPGVYGFYRVNYSSELLSALLPAVRDQTLQARDRLALQSDIFALASCGRLPTSEYLKTLEAYQNETNYTVWSDVDSKVKVLFVFLWNADKASRDRFKKFTLRLFTNISERLGWDPKDGESHLDSLLRGLVLGRMGDCGCKKTIDESSKRLASHVKKSDLIPELRSCVYGNVLSNSKVEEFETIIKLHKTASMREERNRIERNIGAVQEPALMNRVLEFAMGDDVPNNDRVYTIASLATSHAEGRDLVWKFTKNNWEKLHSMYKGQSFMARLVKHTTENFGTHEMATEVEEFFKKHPAEAAERTIQQSLEQIKLRSDWWKRDGVAVCDWLKKHGY